MNGMEYSKEKMRAIIHANQEKKPSQHKLRAKIRAGQETMGAIISAI
jgi:hypothetical protein